MKHRSKRQCNISKIDEVQDGERRQSHTPTGGQLRDDFPRVERNSE